jgi:hypothetical protein
MNVEVVEEIKNKRGELKSKISIITNKKHPDIGLKFENLNTFYKKLLKKYDAKSISIVAQHLDGNWVTLKAFRYLGDNLKHADDAYYSSTPSEVKQKLQGRYYQIKLIIQY